MMESNLQRGEQRTVAGDSHFSFPWAGGTKMNTLRQAQIIAEQVVQEKRRNWTPPVGTYHYLKRALNARCQVARPGSGAPH